MFGLNEIEINKTQEQAVIALCEARATEASVQAGENHNPILNIGVGSSRLAFLLSKKGFTNNGVENRWTQRPTFNFEGLASDFIEALNEVKGDSTNDAGVKRSATVALNKVVSSSQNTSQSVQGHARRSAFLLLDGDVLGFHGLRSLVARHNDIVRSNSFLENGDWSFGVTHDQTSADLIVGGQKLGLVIPELSVENGEIKTAWRVHITTSWDCSFSTITQMISNELSWNNLFITVTNSSDIISATKEAIAMCVMRLLATNEQTIEKRLASIHNEFGLPLEIVSPQMAVA